MSTTPPVNLSNAQLQGIANILAALNPGPTQSTLEERIEELEGDLVGIAAFKIMLLICFNVTL